MNHELEKELRAAGINIEYHNPPVGWNFSFVGDEADFVTALHKFMRVNNFRPQDADWFPGDPGSVGEDDYYLMNDKLEFSLSFEHKVISDVLDVIIWPAAPIFKFIDPVIYDKAKAAADEDVVEIIEEHFKQVFDFTPGWSDFGEIICEWLCDDFYIVQDYLTARYEMSEAEADAVLTELAKFEDPRWRS